MHEFSHKLLLIPAIGLALLCAACGIRTILPDASASDAAAAGSEVPVITAVSTPESTPAPTPTQIAQTPTPTPVSIIELSGYLGDKSVDAVAAAVGGMEITSTGELRECAVGSDLTIGISSDNTYGAYNQITDVINSGNENVTLFGIKIGDTLKQVKAGCDWSYSKQTGTDEYMFMLGDAATFKAVFSQNALASYTYEVRYTG